MLEGDNTETAQRSAWRFQDVRIRHFHDLNRLAGKVIAHSIGAAGYTAWDMYLFYSIGNVWAESFLAPFDWAHQLDGVWAHPDHFAWGDDLNKRLAHIMSRLLKE